MFSEKKIWSQLQGTSTIYDAAPPHFALSIPHRFARRSICTRKPAGPFSGSPRGGGEICLGGRRRERVNGQEVLIRVYINTLANLVGPYFPISIYIPPVFPTDRGGNRDLRTHFEVSVSVSVQPRKASYHLFGGRNNDYHDLEFVFSCTKYILHSPITGCTTLYNNNCITMSNKPIFVATHPRACSTAFERACSKLKDPQTSPANLT